MTPRSIAVLKPCALGDLMFALPAVATLRAAWPRSRLALLGRRWQREFMRGRGFFDEVIEMPAVPGVGAPPGAGREPAAVERFVAQMRLRHFDLALQLYGGGGYSNAFVLRLGARRTVGLRAAGAAALDVELPYAYLQNERLRLLEAVALAGAPAAELDPRLPVLDRDRRELEAKLAPLPARPLAVLQPGATDPRRRWPAKRFAAVGDALARAGAAVAVNGSAEEAGLVAEVGRAMRSPALDLSGRLSLSGLAALLERAALVVSNDTGPLHLALALGTPSAGIYWLTNALISAPLAGRHRMVLSSTRECPVCGADNLGRRCPHDVSFVADVSPEAVIEAAMELWPHRAAASAPRAASR